MWQQPGGGKQPRHSNVGQTLHGSEVRGGRLDPARPLQGGAATDADDSGDEATGSQEEWHKAIKEQARSASASDAKWQETWLRTFSVPLLKAKLQISKESQLGTRLVLVERLIDYIDEFLALDAAMPTGTCPADKATIIHYGQLLVVIF